MWYGLGEVYEKEMVRKMSFFLCEGFYMWIPCLDGPLYDSIVCVMYANGFAQIIQGMDSKYGLGMESRYGLQYGGNGCGGGAWMGEV